jgi:hypothetical protein
MGLKATENKLQALNSKLDEEGRERCHADADKQV